MCFWAVADLLIPSSDVFLSCSFWYLTVLLYFFLPLSVSFRLPSRLLLGETVCWWCAYVLMISKTGAVSILNCYVYFEQRTCCLVTVRPFSNMTLTANCIQVNTITCLLVFVLNKIRFRDKLYFFCCISVTLPTILSVVVFAGEFSGTILKSWWSYIGVNIWPKGNSTRLRLFSKQFDASEIFNFHHNLIWLFQCHWFTH